MKKVFIYWDNSNIYISAKEVAAAREGADARAHLRIDFRNLLQLAHADRPTHRAFAVGSIPPPLQDVWDRLENEGVKVQLLNRSVHGKEVGVDQELQTNMLRDGYDHNGTPGIAVLLTGDGAGFADGAGFHADLERMHRKGWRIEVLSWKHSCNSLMQKWAQENGEFIALDDYYESITFLRSPDRDKPALRPSKPLDLSRRPV